MIARTESANAMSVAVGMAQPARPSVPGVDRGVEQGRHDHPADRRGDRQGRAGGLAQVTGHELALELETGDEEEDRQQAVRGPRRQGQVEVQRRGTDP